MSKRVGRSQLVNKLEERMDAILDTQALITM